MESLNVKNINDEKIFNVIDPNGQGEVVNRIRPISISINQKAETINDQTDSTINLAVYWNDTWKSILDLTFDDSLRQEYGKLTEDLTKIQKDIDMKQYKDAETKTADFLKYVANLSSKYTAIPEKAVVSKTKNDFVKIKADKNSVKIAISDKLLNFMLKKYAKVDNLDYTKSNECFSTSKFNCLANNYDIYYHSPEIFQKQAYMTVVKDNKVVGSYKVNYDQFSKFASKFMLTPQKLGYSKDRLAGYMKTAEVVMQNIFFDSVDEAKEWQEMVDEKKKEQATAPEGEEETKETTTTETKIEKGEGKSESPIKEDGGLARPSEDFASDEIPESEPRQQEQQGGGQNLGASRRVKNVKKIARVGYNAEPENELEEIAVKIGDEIMNVEWDFGEEIQNLEDILEEKPKNKRKIEEMILELKGKRKEKIKKVVEKYNKEFANKEIAGLVYEHLQDHNAHKANSIVLSIINGKQASNKVKLNKKAEEKLYKYEELSEDAKDNVRSVFSEDDHSWWYEDLFPEEQEYLLKEKYAQYNVELDNLDIEWDNYNRCTVNLKDKFAYWDAFRTIWVDCAKQVLKDLPMFKDNPELLEDWATEAASDMYFQHDHFETYSGLNDIDGQDGMELSYKISDLCTKAYEDKVEPILSDIAGDFENILEKQEEYFYSEDYIKEECAVREILFDENGNMVKEGKKRKSLNKNAKNKILTNKRKAKRLNKKALYGDVQEQDIVPAKTETKVYLKSEKEDEDTIYFIKDEETEEDISGDIMGITEAKEQLKEYQIKTNHQLNIFDRATLERIASNIKKAEEQTVEENEILAIGDIVAIDVDTFENEKEFIQYGDYAGIPLVLMETDKDNIDNVIVETVDYPYERISVARIKIVPIGAIADEQVIVEDIDGDEMITTFEELPIVAKQCKIKSIHKAARFGGK